VKRWVTGGQNPQFANRYQKPRTAIEFRVIGNIMWQEYLRWNSCEVIGLLEGKTTKTYSGNTF